MGKSVEKPITESAILLICSPEKELVLVKEDIGDAWSIPEIEMDDDQSAEEAIKNFAIKILKIDTKISIATQDEDETEDEIIVKYVYVTIVEDIQASLIEDTSELFDDICVFTSEDLAKDENLAEVNEEHLRYVMAFSRGTGLPQSDEEDVVDAVDEKMKQRKEEEQKTAVTSIELEGEDKSVHNIIVPSADKVVLIFENAKNLQISLKGQGIVRFARTIKAKEEQKEPDKKEGASVGVEGGGENAGKKEP